MATSAVEIESVVLREVLTSDGTAPRVAALPLRLAREMRAEAIADALRSRFGGEPLDYLVLDDPVSLSEDSRDNDVDHASRLLVAWDAMGRLVELGVVRQLGVANAGEAVIDLLQSTSVPPALNQIELHPFLISDSLVGHCRDRGIAVHALRPLGPLDGPAPEVLGDPVVTDLAQAHGRSPAQIVLKWCLSRVDGVVLDSAERALAGSLDDLAGFELSPNETAALTERNCGHRIDRSPSTLASIHGYLAAEPISVSAVDTEELEVGCHKVLYAPVTSSESFNRRFSFLVWRGLFNLPATVKHVVRPPPRTPLSERIAADLDRNGFALATVAELGWQESFDRLAEKAAGGVGGPGEMRFGRRDTELGEEIEVPADLRAAVDSYFGLETIMDARYVVSTPGHAGVLGIARRQQLWHSDSEDLITVKVYTYLNDVEALSGALEYIAETHPKGRFAVEVAELWKRSFVKDPTSDHSFQVPDDILFRHVRPDLLRRLEGPAGTVVIFDARGLHRGGHVLRGVRQVGVTSHTAPMDAHGQRPPASEWGSSRWASMLSRFQWQTNVTLKGPEGKRGLRDARRAATPNGAAAEERERSKT
jgi:diketogulonate reductase-like aldo/keto reductase